MYFVFDRDVHLDINFTIILRIMMGIIFFTAAIPYLSWAETGDPDTAKLNYVVIFEGNKDIRSSRLKKEASRYFQAFEEHEFRRSDIDDAAYRMEVYYHKEGYAFAEVEHQVRKDKDPVKVVFSIYEGPRTYINKIVFDGNTVFSHETLSSFFNISTGKLFKDSGNLFIRSEIDRGFSMVEDYYLDNGFLDVEIEKPEVVFSHDRTSATIKGRIKEGKQYIIREVNLTGDIVPSAVSDIEETRNFFVGQPYVRRQKLILQSRLLNIYKSLGYAYVKVDVEDKHGAEPRDVQLIANVHSGPIIYISGIEVKGNQDTREAFILSCLRIQVGDRYSAEKENEAFRRLYETGLFSKVNLNLERGDDSTLAVLVVEVLEVPSLEFYLEPGWGSYESLRLRAGLRERSLFGTGLIVNPEGKISKLTRNLSFKLTDPWLFNTDITADVPVYYNYREEPSFSRRDIGLGLYLSKKITHHWEAATEYNLRRTDILDLETKEIIESSETDYNLGSIAAQGTYNTLDDIFFPSKGKRFFLAVEYADKALGSDITLTRFTGGIRLFYNLHSRTILGLRYKGGILLPGEDEIELPISERFFNGGENSVRSFREAELGPKDSSGKAVGGYGYNVVNLELRQRIVGNFVGTIFVDMGNVSPNLSRLEERLPSYESRSDLMKETMDDFFRDFRPGIGMGFQYLLPIGPLRLDFAFNPDNDKERGESEYVIHFSIGAAF